MKTDKKARTRNKTRFSVVGTPMSFEQLRSVISDEIVKLRRGDTNAQNVNAITNACGKFLGSVKTEIELCKFIGKTPRIMGVLPENLDASSKTQP